MTRHTPEYGIDCVSAGAATAAPEMLEALRVGVQCLEGVATGKGGWAWEEVLQQMQDAIAKAEGRQS